MDCLIVLCKLFRHSAENVSVVMDVIGRTEGMSALVLCAVCETMETTTADAQLSYLLNSQDAAVRLHTYKLIGLLAKVNTSELNWL